MEQNKLNHEEREVELVPIFVWLGRGISGFFNSIGRFIVGMGHLFILFLIFLQRNLILILGITFLGGALGWYLNQGSKNLYTLEMRVQPNFNSTEQLVGQVEYMQSLIDQKETTTLAKFIGVTSSQATSLNSFKIEPYFNDTELLVEYDELARKSDSIALENFTFEGFKNSKRNFEYEKQAIIISGTNPYALNKAADNLISIKETSGIRLNKEAAIVNVNYKIEALEYQSGQIASILSSYALAIGSTNSGSEAGTTNIYSGSSQNDSKFQELFNQKNNILLELKKAQELKYSYQQTILEISRYVKKGTLTEQRLILKFLFLFFVIAIILASIPKFWSFLNEYEDKPSNDLNN
jgi:hypothetical protein